MSGPNGIQEKYKSDFIFQLYFLFLCNPLIFVTQFIFCLSEIFEIIKCCQRFTCCYTICVRLSVSFNNEQIKMLNVPILL